MKTINNFKWAFGIVIIIIIMLNHSAHAQCSGAYIKIDNNLVLADNGSKGIKLPYWLKTGQTLAADQNVNSISVIEFNVLTATLTFSQVLSITTTATVPPDAVWKIESVSKKAYSNVLSSSANTNSVIFSYGTGGNYTWTAPSCVYYICAELWGGGGGGGAYNGSGYGGGGGGGGAYARVCTAVTPGTTYLIAVGVGGAGGKDAAGTSGGNSSIIIGATTYTAGGGSGGGYSSSANGTGGNGGTTTNATVFTNGQNGGNAYSGTMTGRGGSGGNGGTGGFGGTNATNNPSYIGGDGKIPGGGGGGCSSSTAYVGGRGGDGQMIISW